MDQDRLLYEHEDVLGMLDAFLADRGGGWWDGFFADRARPCPFFVDGPDESLVGDFESGALRPGRVLELGCGHGRNALRLARLGCEVDAVDFSREAIAWARERAGKAGLQVNFIQDSIFRIAVQPASYDSVYDCGCFHHLPPHRRKTYVDLVSAALKPDGVFSLVCFRPEGGSGLTDRQVYEQRRLGGGLGYTEEGLRQIFSRAFAILDIRRMRETPPGAGLFGKDFLWAVRMCNRERSAGT